jgi:pilus assembly protein Flp/PilA
MTKLRQVIASFVADRRGVTAMEYGMIAAATIIAIAGFMISISGSLSTLFSTIAASI